MKNDLYKCKENIDLLGKYNQEFCCSINTARTIMVLIIYYF